MTNFYLHHPGLFFRFLLTKFQKGFGPLAFLWVFIGLMLFDVMCRITGRLVKSDFITSMTGKPAMRIPAPLWVVAGNFLCMTLVFHAESAIVKSRMVAPMDFVFALLCCVAGTAFLSNLFVYVRVKRGYAPASGGG